VSTASVWYVRLKPFDKKKGCLLRNWSGSVGRFMSGQWVEIINPDVIDVLRETRQNWMDPSSTLAFDICTYDEAAAIAEIEMKSRDAELFNHAFHVSHPQYAVNVGPKPSDTPKPKKRSAPAKKAPEKMAETVPEEVKPEPKAKKSTSKKKKKSTSKKKS